VELEDKRFYIIFLYADVWSPMEGNGMNLYWSSGWPI